ncbi:cytochrome P450 [Sodiomyces alkalinus F11]|uniref:Cytochrome P450 n=1 Tax=Sodiomyces alkalinus (strain CBS 110278 / VKM F-3762 / F11) TaxID=1314773 RepID=A0A3N2PYJ0_SODAK|nr:cytochrome P450 [Sodiomyces alkalinus F11]ROT39567.1 cytochrome P450 [Sodiomyces alkalinus F11]
MRETIYLLRLPFRRIYVLPQKYINEYAWKPDDHISSNTDLYERLLGRWTYVGSLTPDDPNGPYNWVVEYVRSELTKQISFYLPAVQEDVASYFHAHTASDNDKTTLPVHDFCIGLCFALYQRIFVGKELARDPEWKAACVELGLSSVGVAGSLMRVPTWLRPAAATFMSGPRHVKANVRRMEAKIRPILTERLENKHRGDIEPPRDFIQWWIQKSIAVGRDPDNLSALVVALIQLNFAGIRSTGLGVMQSFVDIAVHPEYTDDLRAELERVRSTNGREELTVPSLAKLEKMDSFIKESARHVAQNVLSVYRKALRPLRLSDGTVLPAQSYVCVPSIDPDADQETATRPFDGFRWYRQRIEQPDQGARFLSVSSNAQALEFGAGPHACPGRFLAVAVIKAAVAHALTHYELRLPSAQKPKVPQYNHVLVYTPDTKQKVEFVRRI